MKAAARSGRISRAVVIERAISVDASRTRVADVVAG
jgi:hypothetical protein